MKIKLKLSVIFLTLLLAIIPLTTITANAMTYDLHIPSYGLYCENQNTDILGKVRYVIDGNGKAVQYSEYTVNANNDLTLYVPFISKAYELPETNITVNGKAVKSEVCYGERYFHNDILRFYSCDIDENLTGTLYTLTTDNESLTVEFKTYENQNFVYLLPYNRMSQKNNGEYSYTLNNVQAEALYQIFVTNGDFEELNCNAQITKENLSVKEYIDRYFADAEYYYSEEKITPDLLYALINRAIENNVNYDFFDFFFSSFSEQRINAYKIDLQSDTESNVIAYSMPVDVQKNNGLNPAIFMIEQTATGNYNINYTIELNGELPYIIESSTNTKKQDNYIYTAQNVSSDFYFIFSSSQKPKSINGNTDNHALRIVLYVILGVAVCALPILIIIAILFYKKEKKIKN